ASSLERSSESSNISSENETNNVLNLKATELSLGLPGFSKSCEENATKGGPIIKNFMSGAKRGFSDVVNLDGSSKWALNTGSESDLGKGVNGVFEINKTSSPDVKPVEDKKKGPCSTFCQGTGGHCSSNGIKGREGLSESNLKDLLHGSECVLTYEDKDGDWMLVGDVPWEMFIDSCKRLRIMKGSEAIGLAPRSTEKCKNKN
ncbi:hypothetical protein M8C21_029239, partial [Ambrosia artemisiifolia]